MTCRSTLDYAGQYPPQKDYHLLFGVNYREDGCRLISMAGNNMRHGRIIINRIARVEDVGVVK